jgi:threonine synthase
MGEIERDERIVCITTGHLLKDPERVIRICEKPKEVEADVDVVRKMMGVKMVSKNLKNPVMKKN